MLNAIKNKKLKAKIRAGKRELLLNKFAKRSREKSPEFIKLSRLNKEKKEKLTPVAPVRKKTPLPFFSWMLEDLFRLRNLAAPLPPKETKDSDKNKVWKDLRKMAQK